MIKFGEKKNKILSKVVLFTLIIAFIATSFAGIATA